MKLHVHTYVPLNKPEKLTATVPLYHCIGQNFLFSISSFIRQHVLDFQQHLKQPGNIKSSPPKAKGEEVKIIPCCRAFQCMENRVSIRR